MRLIPTRSTRLRFLTLLKHARLRREDHPLAAVVKLFGLKMPGRAQRCCTKTYSATMLSW